MVRIPVPPPNEWWWRHNAACEHEIYCCGRRPAPHTPTSQRGFGVRLRLALAFEGGEECHLRHWRRSSPTVTLTSKYPRAFKQGLGLRAKGARAQGRVCKPCSLKRLTPDGIRGEGSQQWATCRKWGRALVGGGDRIPRKDRNPDHPPRHPHVFLHGREGFW